MARDWQNALKPAGENAVSIIMTQNGHANYSIVLPVNQTSQETLAAQLLQKYLGQMTGCSFDIVTEPQKVLDKKVLSVGKTALRQATGIDFHKDLGEVGYSIVIKNGNLYFTGGSRRGPINGVIAFLEEDLGCRWYTRNSKPMIPHQKNLTVSVLPRRYVPILKVRDPFYWDAFEKNWILMNRTNPAWLGGASKECGGVINYSRSYFCHTLAALLPADPYFKTHPEYFALIKGERQCNHAGHHAAHLCFTNPEVADIVAENVCKVLATYLDIELISISQNDGSNGFCQCENCKAMNEKEGGVSGALLAFVNKVAVKVAKKYPNVKITTLAYLESFMPPKTIRPVNNVVIRLCTDTHIWDNPMFFVTETDKFSHALSGWSAIGADIYIWDYTTNFSNYLVPMPNMTVIDRNIATYLKNGVKDIMLQGAYQSPGGARARMRSWVFAKKLWNPSWSMDALMRDFTYGYFGAAGELMQQYNDLLHSEWQQFHDQNQPGAKFKFSDAFLPNAQELFAKAEVKAADDAILLSRIHCEKMAILCYRLEQGPANKADKQNYLNDLHEFLDDAKQFNVTHLGERAKLNDKKRVLIWEAKANRAGYQKTTPGTVPLYIGEARLWPAGEKTAKIVHDPKSLFGSAIYQPGMTSSWSVQWNSMSEKTFKKETAYIVKIHCRIDKKDDNGNAFSCRVYNTAKKTYPCGIIFKTKDIDSAKYQWYTVGKFIPQEHEFLYTAPRNDASVQGIYIDYIELIPEDEL